MERASIFGKFSISVILLLLLLSLSGPAEKSFAATLDDLITSLRSKDYLVQLSAVDALAILRRSLFSDRSLIRTNDPYIKQMALSALENFRMY